MSSRYQTMIEQEAKRREPWQRRPEFQQWLAEMDDGLQRFLALAAGLPKDPFSAAGLAAAETAALEMFSSADEVDPVRRPDNALVTDGFKRFIGEVYVRQLEGRWVYLDVTGEGGFAPAVELPFLVERVVGELLTEVVYTRTGSVLSDKFSKDRNEYHDWCESGRPERWDWITIRRQKRLKSRQRPMRATVITESGS